MCLGKNVDNMGNIEIRNLKRKKIQRN